MIYLDNAATTPLTPSVIDAMTEIMVNDFGNPSSIHGIGRHANQRLRSYRQTIASALKTDPRRIIFTSGATESNNTAIKGYALANKKKVNTSLPLLSNTTLFFIQWSIWKNVLVLKSLT